MNKKHKAEAAPAQSGQHTPGPWNILSPKGTLCAWRIVSNDDCNVAFVAQRLSNTAADANAALIAQAPQLLAENQALKSDNARLRDALQAIFNDCQDYINGEDGPGPIDTMQAMRETAKAALTNSKEVA